MLNSKVFSKKSGQEPPENIMLDFSTLLTVIEKTRALKSGHTNPHPYGYI